MGRTIESPGKGGDAFSTLSYTASDMRILIMGGAGFLEMMPPRLSSTFRGQDSYR
jgi:hypothetical protein